MSETLPREALRQHRVAMIDAASKHRASNLRIFGSAASGTDTPIADIDVLVTFADDASLLDLVELEDELREITGIPVDVVSNRAQRVSLVSTGAMPL